MADPHSPNGPKGIYVLPFAETEHIKFRHLDLPYCEQSDFQKLDLYLPDGTTPDGGWPLIVFIHGGAWMQCDKRDIQIIGPLRLLERGYALASVNYRLSSEAIFPAQIFDVKAAIRMLRAKAGSFGLDPDRFAVWGCSAGAHLAALTGATNDVAVMEDLHMGYEGSSSSVQAVVDFYGPTKLDQMDEFMTQTQAGDIDHMMDGSPESRLLGGIPDSKPGHVIAANPETWITPKCPPFFFAHAPKDPIVPVQHSVMLSQKITAIAGEGQARLVFVENAGHAGPEFDVPELLEAVGDFLDHHLCVLPHCIAV
ncbi:alpha/beta hydrolase [uncultured Cohaesibacter sp.]|uniref:alpha/beta hydrolase n=1 Tax=uncultured Cohaesibacter sp. TaxID=1002546 RepID=UPI0029C914B8|nr:alpha/beta hydrolase [uncultured Cohaesibacter sp.]